MKEIDLKNYRPFTREEAEQFIDCLVRQYVNIHKDGNTVVEEFAFKIHGVSKESVVFGDKRCMPLEKALNELKLYDGSPFGVKKEESTPEYKGEIEGFPKEVVDRMLDLQEEQGCEIDIGVFEEYSKADFSQGGFNWGETPEKSDFWYEVIINKNFDVFFEEYPKQKHLSEEEEVLKYIRENYEAGDVVRCLHSGDVIKINEFLDDENKFQFYNGSVWLNRGYLRIYKHGKYAEKMPLLLTTEDGVGVYDPETEIHYTPSKNNTVYPYCSNINASKVNDTFIHDEYWLLFSTKKACEEFVNNEKLEKIVRDIVKAFGIPFDDIKKNKVAEVIKIIDQFQKNK